MKAASGEELNGLVLKHGNLKAEGRASSVNVVEASARAYAQALIKLAKMTGKIVAGK